MSRGRHLGFAIGIALALVLPAAQGQPAKDTIPAAKLTGTSQRAAARLAGAQAKADQGQWADAIAEYQTILDENAGELAPLDPRKPDHCVSLRYLCHLRIAGLPAEALKLYRARVDEPAKKRLEQATATRDEIILHRIVEDAFCSRPAEQAIDWLGDLAFERGDFADAQRWWSLLAVPVSQAVAAKEKNVATQPVLLYPDAQADVALVRAKQILAMLFNGDRSAAVGELKAFQALHLKAEGQFAGRKGNYLHTLQVFADKKELGNPIVADSAWSTFGGSASRTPAFVPLPNCRWLEEPWRVRLDGRLADDKPEVGSKPLNASDAARRLAFHPVIAGNRVIVADARYVTVYDLLSGRRLARFDLLENPKYAGLSLDVTLPVKHDERYTLTVADNKLYARLGTTALAYPADAKDGAFPVTALNSALVCLDLAAEDNKLRCCWEVEARANDKDIDLFEGAPLVHEGKVYVARTRFSPTWAVAQIDCYDAQTGVRHWRQEVCEGQELMRPGESRRQQQLLTLAGPNIVYCSHSGAVVAVDANSGTRVWAVRYPRRLYHSTNGSPNPRDLCPCVCAAGRVCAAPADCDRILCLDAYTGRTLWESKPLEVVQLLGVTKGRLIFTTGSFPRSIRALDAVKGSDQRGWMQPEDGQDELPTLGRGLFAGNAVLWPTRKRLWLLNQEDGAIAQPESLALAGVPAGNLAVGNGCLVVATDRELLGYVAPARKLEQRRKQALAEPQSSEARQRLALAQADAGLPDEDGRYLDHLIRLAKSQSIWDGITEAKQVPRQRYELLLEFARQAGRARDWAKAAAYYHCLAAPDLTATQESWQLGPLIEQAKLWERAEKLDEAIKLWQAILQAPTLRDGTAIANDGSYLPAARAAARRIDELIKTHGRKVYEVWESPAALRMVRSNRDERESRRIIDAFPNANAIREAVARRLDEAERAKDHAAAARWCRWQLIHGTDEIRAAAAARLAKAQAAMHKSAVDRATLSVPLKQAWQFDLVRDKLERLFEPEPAANARRCDLFFLRSDGALHCRDAATGKVRWSSELPMPVSWLGCHADLLLAAGPSGLVALSAENGQACWTFRAPSWPFVAPDQENGFAGFQVAGSRLFFLTNERRLLCLDVETGQVLWTRLAPSAPIEPLEPGGRFHPAFLATKDRVLIQTSRGRLWLLDSATGKTLYEHSSKESGPWLQAPILLNEQQVCIVPDGRHIAVFDLVAARELWRSEIDRPTSLSGEAPKLAVNGANVAISAARNYGHELDCLDAVTGQRRWRKPVLIRPGKLHLCLPATDGSSLYVTAGGILQAVSLTDGRRLWETPLPDSSGTWQVLDSGGHLLVFPAQARLNWQPAVLLKRCLTIDPASVIPTQAPWFAGPCLTGLAVIAAESVAPSQLPVLVCEAKNGNVVQRLSLAGQGPAATVRIINGRVIVAVQGAAWGFQ